MDKKLETFLTVCRTMNYREAAEILHLTQPAVTKQIQSLEAEYGVKLFSYDGRHLHKTEKCGILESYARSLEYNYQEMMLSMQEKDRFHLRIGATKTIGDYVIGPAIMSYLKVPEHELTLIVDNTEKLLKNIDDNNIDFAIIEGRFDKKKYDHKLFRKEPFIGVGKINASGKKIIKPESLFKETIIVREKGSGTREFFERDLHNMGYSLSSFERVIELSSFRLIREAVKYGIGISFVYESVINDDPGFYRFNVEGIQREHEFNVVSLKNTPAQKYADRFMEDISGKNNGTYH
nr:LysR family transcriptional regulator [Butyrivibrio sp.]